MEGAADHFLVFCTLVLAFDVRAVGALGHLGGGLLLRLDRPHDVQGALEAL